MNDEPSDALVLSDFDPALDTSPLGNLFSNGGIINPSPEDALLDNFDESYLSNQIPDGPEIASTSCVSTFSPSGKTRKREDQCNALDPIGPNLKLPLLRNVEDMLQQALQRKFCSQTMISGADFIPVCGYSGLRADPENFWHVSGFMCEFIALSGSCYKLLR